MAGDNGIAKYDAATGSLQIGEATLTDPGSIEPTANDGGALGSASLAWSDLFLAAGGVLNWDAGAVTVTEGGAGANTLAFAGPTQGYWFQTGPLTVDGSYLQGVNQTVTNFGAVTGRTKLSFADYDADGVLVAAYNSGTPANGRLYPLTGVWNNLLLHSAQCTVSGFGADVSQGTMFWLTAQPNAGAVFALSDGTTTRQYGATSGGDVQYTIGASLSDTLTNMAAAITGDGSGLWDAVHVTDSLSGVHSGASAGCVVIYRRSQPTFGADRIYETVTFSTGNPQTIDFGDDADYRRASNASAAIALPTSDPGSRSFGVGKRSNTGPIRNGEMFPSLFDATISMADQFGDAWDVIGGSGTDLSPWVPYIKNTTPETATFTGTIGEMHLVDLSGGNFTCNLPAAATAGRIAFFITDTNGQLTIDPNGSETINGKLSLKISAGGNTIESDGTQWYLIQKTGRNPFRLDPATIATDQNNYNPTDWGRDVTDVFLNSSADVTITGFEENGFVDMDEVIITNNGSNDITIAHDSASSTANNRVLIEGGAPVILQPNGVTSIIRDGTANQWRLRYTQGVNVRSDATGTDVIGSSGAPVTLTPADTYQAQSGFTDTRDFSTAVWYVTIPAKGTATKITVKIEWSEDASNLSQQGSESITSGVSTLSEYIAEYDISLESAPFNLPAIVLPVAGPNAKVSVKSDLGTTTTTYVRVWRQA
jgi:hypothetical protein